MTMQKGLIAAAVAALMALPAHAVEVAISGAVEVEASNSEDYSGATTSDIIRAYL